MDSAVLYVGEFPYLTAAAAAVLLAETVVRGTRCRRAWALRSGLFAMPLAAWGLVFVPEYWQPQRLFHLQIGIEDVLFEFIAGYAAWAFVDGEIRRRGPRMVLRPGQCLRRYCGLAAISCTVFFPLRGAGVMSMHAAWIIAGVFVAYLLWLHPAWWRAAVYGALGFTAGYCAVLTGILMVAPTLRTWWTIPNLSGIFVVGFPIEEIAWAVAWGACWPLAVAHVFAADACESYDECRQAGLGETTWLASGAGAPSSDAKPSLSGAGLERRPQTIPREPVSK